MIILCSVNVTVHLMCTDWHAVTMVTFSHLLTTTVVCTAPNTRVQLTHLSNLTLLLDKIISVVTTLLRISGIGNEQAANIIRV